MEALAKLQHDFQEYVLRGRKRIVRTVQAASRSAAVGRLDVYARAYELRLLEVLRTDFPALHVLAGDEVFEALGRAYIRAHPSDSPNARWFGRHLAAFLARSDSLASHGLLAEMARFEWAMGLAFDAPDQAVPFCIDDLASIPAERFPSAVFQVHPSVQRLDLTSNVPDLWKAVDSETAPPEPAMAPEPIVWIVWRPLLATYFRSLEPDEANALDAVAAGKDFGLVCETLAAAMDSPAVPARAAQLARRWAQEGLISGMALSDGSD